MPPRTVGPYEVLAVIGRGGIGTVHRARHRETGHLVALKLLGPPPACDSVAARRLAREFEALQDLDHPNVVRAYEAGVCEGYSYLAMELVEGLDLRSYLSPMLPEEPPVILRSPRGGGASESEASSDEPDPSGALTGPEAIRAFANLMDEPATDAGAADPVRGEQPAQPAAAEGAPEPRPVALVDALNGAGRMARLRDAAIQVCEGLAYVHARGLVHRDLKPSNIMVDDRRCVRLMDFGLVKLASDATHATQQGRVVGTYRYMAPEQARGEAVDGRADLYSLGVILFELLCGRPPFTASRSDDLREEIVSRQPPGVLSLNPGADPALARLAEQLLAKDRRERLQRAEDVARELRR